MKKERTIQKGNVKEGSFDVRIIESNGKTYYYHFLELVDGQQAIESQKPINLKGVEDILWDNLPFTVKEIHCKKIYPNYNLNDYKTRCLLFGKEQTDQALAEDRKKEEKRDLFESQKSYCFPIYSHLAMKVYDQIGWYENVEVVHEKGRFRQFIVDDKYVVKAHTFDIISIQTREEDEANKKEWGRRINEIAQSAGTSFNFATVVANISEKDKAVKILKRIYAELNSEEFNCHMKCQYMYSDYNTNEWSLKNGIRSFMDKVLSSEYTNNLNLSSKFYNAVKEILNNK